MSTSVVYIFLAGGGLAERLEAERGGGGSVEHGDSRSDRRIAREHRHALGVVPPQRQPSRCVEKEFIFMSRTESKKRTNNEGE